MALVSIGLLACSGEEIRVLRVGGIPDQDATHLARRYQGFSEYMSAKLGVEVENIFGSKSFSGFSNSETTIRLSQLVELGGKRAARIR